MIPLPVVTLFRKIGRRVLSLRTSLCDPFLPFPICLLVESKKHKKELRRHYWHVAAGIRRLPFFFFKIPEKLSFVQLDGGQLELRRTPVGLEFLRSNPRYLRCAEIAVPLGSVISFSHRHLRNFFLFCSFYCGVLILIRTTTRRD